MNLNTMIGNIPQDVKETKRIFRFDDICANTDIENLVDLVYCIQEHTSSFGILFGISPLSFWPTTLGDDKVSTQRVFPKVLNAFSDPSLYYAVDQYWFEKLPIGFLENMTFLIYAAHGLVHVDHRLLSYDAQEMSIVTSCSLIHTKHFIPPFNKWNQDTIDICDKHKYRLYKFEDGWRGVEYNTYDVNTPLWYLHPGNFTPEKLAKWFASGAH